MRHCAKARGATAAAARAAPPAVKTARRVVSMRFLHRLCWQLPASARFPSALCRQPIRCASFGASKTNSGPIHAQGMPAMPATLPHYEVYALRYATRDAQRRDHFISGDPHDGPMPMDYYVWLALGRGGAYVIDTGFTAEMAKERKRTFLRCPIDSLALLGVEAGAVRDVILTHLPSDPGGHFHKLRNARFHLQEREMAYATGKYMRYPRIGHSFHVEDVVGMVRLNFKGRVEMHAGEVEVAPGLTLHPTYGHSDGLQSVRVHTKRGWVVLASDATHYYENMATNRPFTTAFHIGGMLDAYRTLERLAPTPRHIIPGHDPHVMKEYPAPKPALEGIAVRLDVESTGPALTFAT